MRKTLKTILLLSVLCGAFAYGVVVMQYRLFPYNQLQYVKNILTRNISHQFESALYLHKTSFFKVNSQSDYDVVFIGDSITDGSDWYDIFPKIKIANRGISGDTTAGVLNRMDTIINTGAEKAFLMIGVNDINKATYNIDAIFNNYTQIIFELQKNKIKPFVQSILLTDHLKIDNQGINKLNTRLMRFCNDNDIVFIDLNPLLSKSGKLNKNYSFDGVHINGEAYAIWSKAIEEYVY